MVRQLATLLVVGLLPGLCLAQTGPERLLAPDSQIYFRFDGLTAHKEARQKTAFGKTMQGDTGKFAAALCQYAREMIEVGAGMADPQLAQLAKDALKVLETGAQHGFGFGLEIRSIQPPQAGATLVVNKAAPHLLPLLQKLATLARADLNETQIGKQTLYHIPVGPVNVGWWNEGDDAVIVIGTATPQETIKKMHGEGYGLGKNALYKELAAFNNFPTCCHGYLDTAGLFKVIRTLSPEISRLFTDLGLDGLKGITGHTGFDGLAHRTIVDIHTTAQRKGLLRMASQKSFSLADLPPMPPDIGGFGAATMDPAGAYEAIIQAIEAGVRIFAPDKVEFVKEGLKQFEALIGVKIGEELFGSLGDLSVSYNSSGESFLGLGAMTLIKVKDAQKLQRALDGLANLADKIPGDQIRVEKKKYRGVDIYEIHLKAPGQFSLPTLAIHKGWLAFTNYPHVIKGFILRMDGELPAWKAGKQLNEALAKLPKDYIALSVGDPRPGVRFMLSAIPPVLRAVNSLTVQFVPGAPQFDISLAPNGHEAVRYLFPTITVTTDDGQKIRTDRRSALPF